MPPGAPARYDGIGIQPAATSGQVGDTAYMGSLSTSTGELAPGSSPLRPGQTIVRSDHRADHAGVVCRRPYASQSDTMLG